MSRMALVISLSVLTPPSPIIVTLEKSPSMVRGFVCSVVPERDEDVKNERTGVFKSPGEISCLTLVAPSIFERILYSNVFCESIMRSAM